MFRKAPGRLVNRVIADIRDGKSSSAYSRGPVAKIPELWLYKAGVWAQADGRSILVAFSRTDVQCAALNCPSGYYKPSRLGSWRIRRAVRAWGNSRG